MQFSTAAHWIWIEGEESPRNFWLRARRAFHCPSELRRASLLISADSRYELYINGHWLDVGPARSYPWAYSYDEYDVTAWLQQGAENVLAARVVHWGDHSFQYVRVRGGLLCELVLEHADGTVERIVSDGSWLVAPDEAVVRNTARICPMQGYEEHVDARLHDESWLTTTFDKRGWHSAHMIGTIEEAPWKGLNARSIPFLMRDEVTPQRVMAVEIALPLKGYRWNLDVRPHFSSPESGLWNDSPATRGRAFVTEVVAPQTCEVKLYDVPNYDPRHVSCNGQSLREGLLLLNEGRNLLVVAGSAHPSLLFATSAELTFDASQLLQGEEASWAYFAPFDERGTHYKQLMSASNRESLPDLPRQPVSAADLLAEDIFSLTSTQEYLLPISGFCDRSIDTPQPRQRITPQQETLVTHSSHLLHRNANFTTLYPQAEGDIHVVIEFERELIGYPVLELDAAESTIIDANLFEVIDDSGIFWTNLLRNSFRYTCREGYQVFRSSVRRGFRYIALTLRNVKRPVKLYNVRCLMSTYPVEKRGNFTSSDALLNTIWETAAYTVQLCMEDTYTDCPAYEQTFYVGDARNSALINAMAFGAYDLTDRCLRLTAQSLSPELNRLKRPTDRGKLHLTNDQIASGWVNTIPMWTFMWIWNVWEHYIITGDRSNLSELYPDVRECLRRCMTYLTERDLFDIPDVSNLVDWTPMDMPRDGEVTANNVLLVESLQRAALMAETLAMTDAEAARLRDEATRYKTDATRVREAVNRYCWSEERGAYVDSVRDEAAYERYTARMQERGLEPEERGEFFERERISEPTNTLVLLCNCAPGERATRILPLIESAPTADYAHVEPNWKPVWTRERIVPVGSPWFLFFTAETLTKYGKIDAVVQTIRKHWGYMLQKGTTTFWEMFRYWTDEHWSRSLCHGWAGGPTYFLSNLILGVEPAQPGFKTIRIKPFTSDLQWAKGSVPTPHGDVFVNWSRTEQHWQIEVAAPADIPTELTSPEFTAKPEHVSGFGGTLQQDGEQWRIVLPAGGRTEYRIAIR